MLRAVAFVVLFAAVAHCAPAQDVNAVVPEATAVAAARHPIFAKTVALFGWLDPENWFDDDSSKKKAETAGSCVDKIEESVKKDIASMLADIPKKAKTTSEIAAKNAVQGQLVDQHLMHCKMYKAASYCDHPKAIVGCAKTCGTCRPEGSVLPANETKVNDEVEHALAEVKHGLLEIVLKVVDSMVKTHATDKKDTKETDKVAKEISHHFDKHLVKDTKEVVKAAKKAAKQANKAAIVAAKKAARHAVRKARKAVIKARQEERKDLTDAGAGNAAAHVAVHDAVSDAIKNHKQAKAVMEKAKKIKDKAREAKIQQASDKALAAARAAHKKFKKQDKKLHAMAAKAAGSGWGSGRGSGYGYGYGDGSVHVMTQALALP